MRILETERILLKPIEEEDLTFLMNLRWDKDITQFIIHDPISKQDQKKWYEKISKGNNLALSVFYKDPKNTAQTEIIGTVGLFDVNMRHQHAKLKSTRILAKYQGSGIVFEVLMLVLDYGFNTLNLNKVFGDSFEENTPIIKILETLGFQKEGVLRNHYFHEGMFKNAIALGLLREDFNKLKSGL
ncbi:MAG: GNAT family N-acetyltransferase [Bacteroidales bacterium]|jgi:RimJ/RimL family protein N-acetyltransferase|nr:GNAT family N-acetyltransferase [Bacteroidales bacterium]